MAPGDLPLHDQPSSRVLPAVAACGVCRRTRARVVYRVAAAAAADRPEGDAARGISFGATMRNAVVGLVVATAAALVAADVRIFGIESWKVVLGAFGLWLFVTAGRGREAGAA